MTELKPCPFCGGPIARIKLKGDTLDTYPSVFECTTDGCRARVIFLMDKEWNKEDEISKWNRRAT